MNPFLEYVNDITKAFQDSQALSVQGKYQINSSDSKALIFSPHPDDECIIGLLPLRLQRELNYEIVNIPMTFGSLKKRREERLKELDDACRYLGWNNHLERDDLENLTIENVVSVLLSYRPRLIVFPHINDWNSRHIAVHKVVMEALSKINNSFRCIVVECEFWNTMETPNCIVEASEEHLATLVAATSLHKGEVARNPYHLSLPAWMIDNIRRGTEIIGGQGGDSPGYMYGTLYRIQEWVEGRLQKWTPHQISLSKEEGNLNHFNLWK